jgi:hypothetical protein
MKIIVKNKSGVFGVWTYTSIKKGTRLCGCTRSDCNKWADWAIGTHTFLRNTIGLE